MLETLKILVRHLKTPITLLQLPILYISYYFFKIIKKRDTKYSWVIGVDEIAGKYNIDFVEIDSVDGKRLIDYKETIKKLNLDLILVMGWYYLIPKSIRKLAKKGAWGFHSSLLPKYAGGAPLTWAIINDEKKTGVTFFRFKDGIDNGDIISQKSFKIEYEDTIKEVLKKTASEIYNFIRAQSSPYPGAFIKTADGKKIIIEKAKKK